MTDSWRPGKPPLGVTGPFTFRLFEGQPERLMARARPGESLSEVVRRALTEWLTAQEAGHADG